MAALFIDHSPEMPPSAALEHKFFFATQWKNFNWTENGVSVPDIDFIQLLGFGSWSLVNFCCGETGRLVFQR